MGSLIVRRQNGGLLHDIEVVGHQFVPIDDEAKLFYLYDAGSAIPAMVAADAVQPVGDEWNLVYLNRKTGETRETLDDDGT